MRVGHRRDLRQMRDAEHLLAARNVGKLLRDLLRGSSADARVHLVEDQRLHRILLGKDVLHRQHDARKLAAGCNLAQRLERLANVCRHQKAHAVHSRRRKRDLLKLTDEADLRHIELGKLRLYPDL